LNAVYLKPATPRDAEDLRSFIKQIRLETGLRVCAKVYENSDKPSKVLKFSEKNYYNFAINF